MATFTYRDDLITLMKNNQSVKPDTGGLYYPPVIKSGQEVETDSRVGGGAASANSGLWQVDEPLFGDSPSGAGLVDERASLRMTYEAEETITEANFLNAVEDIQQQFRENNDSVSRTYRITMQGRIDEAVRFADFIVLMEKFLADGTT